MSNDIKSLPARLQDADPAVRKLASAELHALKRLRKAERIAAALTSEEAGDHGLPLPADARVTVQDAQNPILTAKDLSSKRRARLFSLAVRALERELTATTPVGEGIGKSRIVRHVPDWPARDRAADKVLSLLGSYPGKSAPVVKSKLPTMREPAWKTRLKDRK